MSEITSIFKFCHDADSKKVTRGLSDLKNISYLICVIFADEIILNTIESHVRLHFGASQIESKDHEMEIIDMHDTMGAVASILKFIHNESQKTKEVKSFKFFIFSTKKSASKLDDLILDIIYDRSNFFKSVIGKSDLIMLLNSIKVWSIGDEYENQFLEETVLHHYLLEKNSMLVNFLLNFGCVPSMRRFILRFDSDTISYMANQGFINQEILENQFLFHQISFSYACKPYRCYELERIFKSIVSCVPSKDLSRLFLLRCPENKNLNAIDYACRNQADTILELILNTEKAFKTTDNAINYDVSNIIPDTLISSETEFKDFTALTIEPMKIFGGSFQVSCLERIIASSEIGESKASRMLDVKPITYLIDQYILISKFIRFIMFLIQFFYMISFTWFNMNSVSGKISELVTGLCALNASGITGANCTIKVFEQSRIFTVLWIIWPLFSFLFTTYQFAAMTKVLSCCDVKSSFVKTMRRFPWLDLMILISTIFWLAVVAMQILLHSYFQLVAVIFIVGWLRSALFISFCSHWHGFVVSLQSSLSKYFISFVFVFIFVYAGFSFALRMLLTEYESSEKPLYIIAFKTLAAVFGMGNLDEIPDEIEEFSGKAFFLKAVIISYCSLVAILVLAIIRQPDTELVVKVESELFPRLKLRLLKDVVWLMRWRKSRNIEEAGEPKYGSLLYELHEAFGVGGRTLKVIDGRYVLRYYKEEMDEIKEMGEESRRIKLILEEIVKIRSDLAKLIASLK